MNAITFDVPTHTNATKAEHYNTPSVMITQCRDAVEALLWYRNLMHLSGVL